MPVPASCGFLHQYDKENISVCQFFWRYGKCREKDCLYKHTFEEIIDGDMYCFYPLLSSCSAKNTGLFKSYNTNSFHHWLYSLSPGDIQLVLHRGFLGYFPGMQLHLTLNYSGWQHRDHSWGQGDLQPILSQDFSAFSPQVFVPPIFDFRKNKIIFDFVAFDARINAHFKVSFWLVTGTW
ncbi:Cleavage and polyadenylation specificity factor CPSF30 [Platanthera zijinensis]|uniref:Cleavage and polyadenylation specificity factor CPSF30 n=1 Tax=Platanthera zijinensis TaxID=2320716 RepID=A0AAP0GDZ3_9ASPA